MKITRELHQLNISSKTPAIVAQIIKAITNVNPKKTTGLYKILINMIKLSICIIISHITKIINNDLSKNSFSNHTKFLSLKTVIKRLKN